MLEIVDYNTPSPNEWRMVIKGMRNAYKSWDKSDSVLEENYIYLDTHGDEITLSEAYERVCFRVTAPIGLDNFFIGNNDKNLLMNLSKLGTSDRKVLRQLNVTLEIRAPLFWWKQMDTYKIGTTTNSESTMHSITNKKFSIYDFSIEALNDIVEPCLCGTYANVFNGFIIDPLNDLRDRYKETGDHRYWKAIIELLPESYLQTRTWTGSYENILNMILQRYDHKLEEWQFFCKWCIQRIPLIKELIEEIKPEILEFLCLK